MGAGGRIRALFFPHRCVFCDSVISYNSLICADCHRQLPYLLECQKDLCALAGAAAPLRYEGTARERLLEYKAQEHRGYARYFARLCAKAAKEAFGDAAFDLAACVPNHEPHGQRVYNPARVLARETAKLLQLPFCADALRQSKEKKKQHTLPRTQRAQNVANIFSAQQGAALSGKRILLFDDILTTGATLEACARELLQSGALEVWGLTAAKTKAKEGFTN